jgi:hypothetical protein
MFATTRGKWLSFTVFLGWSGVQTLALGMGIVRNDGWTPAMEEVVSRGTSASTQTAARFGDKSPVGGVRLAWSTQPGGALKGIRR